MTHASIWRLLETLLSWICYGTFRNFIDIDIIYLRVYKIYDRPVLSVSVRKKIKLTLRFSQATVYLEIRNGTKVREGRWEDGV